MLDIKFIVDNAEEVKKSAKARFVSADVDGVIALYEKLRKIKHELDETRAEANRVAKEIPSASEDERPALIEKGGALKSETSKLGEELTEVEDALNEGLLTIPNLLPADTPDGANDNANVAVRSFMEPTKFDFEPKDHLELGRDLDLLDFDSGAKVAGSKFYFLKNEAVLLEYAIKQFAMQKAVEKGYAPLITPDLARNEILLGAGFNPRGEESNTYRIEETDMSLVATAEIAVGGMHADEILDEDRLPLKYVADSHCFRVEAGGGGQASKGLYRVHQFSKIELYQFTTPGQSEQAHEEMVELEEEIFKALKIPFQVVRICAGDLGAPAYKKYDIEAWMPGKEGGGGYGEITSASNCTDFQARRLNVRYKPKEGGKNVFVHTLNGTATALSRTLIVILENYQTADGGVIIPEALRPYMGGMEKIEPKS